jgi:hypothetical protein
MVKSLKLLTAAVLVAGGFSGFTRVASADLVGGTYTPLTLSSTTWPGSPVLTSLANGSALSSATTAQGFPVQDGSASGTILSEVITPASTFTLGSVVIPAGGAAPFASGIMSLHIYPLTFTSGSPFASASSSVYNVGTDLLGGGSGLPFSSNGLSGGAFLAFNVNNGVTSDQVTLNGGTMYAVEFWDNTNQTSYTQFPITWFRNGGVPADPGGQMFGSKNIINNPSASDTTTGLRGTIAQMGLAGSSPRIGAIALYSSSNPVPVPEPVSAGVIAMAAGGLMLRRRRQA